MLTGIQRQFVLRQRVGHLATADIHGVPHVVPVCFALSDTAVYVVIDQKPKRVAPERLKRVRNILNNPKAALVVDRYDDDWDRLGWVTLRGQAELVTDGPEHAEALGLLRERYTQYRAMALERAPVIALRIERVVAWGEVSPWS